MNSVKKCLLGFIMAEFLILLCLSSCNAQSKEFVAKDVAQNSDQLYAYMESSFDYYYSTELSELDNCTKLCGELKADSEPDRFYLLGGLDNAKSYHALYNYLTYTRQKDLEVKIYPEQIKDALSSFLETKQAYFEALSKLVKENNTVLYSNGFKTHCEDLINETKKLNIDLATALKEEGTLNDYIQALKSATELMQKFNSASADIMESSEKPIASSAPDENSSSAISSLPEVSSRSSSTGKAKPGVSITVKKVDMIEAKEKVISDEAQMKKILTFVDGMFRSDFTSPPATGGTVITVSVTRNGVTEEHAFLEDEVEGYCLAKNHQDPDVKNTWYFADAEAFSYLSKLFK